MTKRIHTLRFILADWLAAVLAWGMFFIYRKLYIEFTQISFNLLINDSKFIWGIFILPVCWVAAYALFGTYQNVYRKSRLKELGQTLYISIIGVLIIFFSLLLDDAVNSYKTYYHTIFTLLTLHFLVTAFFRFLLSSNIIRNIRRRNIRFNTVMIGSNTNAVQLLHQMEKEFHAEGNAFVGFVHVDGNNDHLLSKHMANLGGLKNLREIISTYRVEEAIIALESSEHLNIGKIINELELFNFVFQNYR